MGLRAMVKKQVQTAFNKIGDLAVDVTLIQKDATGFDFNTQSLIETAQVTKVIKGILLKVERSGGGETPNTISQEVLLKSEDVGDLTVYDKATINGYTWNISHPVEDNGYTVQVTMTREG